MLLGLGEVKDHRSEITRFYQIFTGLSDPMTYLHPCNPHITAEDSSPQPHIEEASIGHGMLVIFWRMQLIRGRSIKGLPIAINLQLYKESSI